VSAYFALEIFSSVSVDCLWSAGSDVRLPHTTWSRWRVARSTPICHTTAQNSAMLFHRRASDVVMYRTW